MSPKRSTKELLKLFKKSVKKVMLAQKFIKNSKELVFERKEERRKQLDAEKRALKARFEREEKERLKRLEAEKRKNKTFSCQYSMYAPQGQFQASFRAQAYTMDLACQQAQRDCNFETRGTRNFCSQGTKGNIFPICEVRLIGRRNNRIRGTFHSQHQNPKMACSMARSQCQDKIKRRISRAPNPRARKR